MDLKADHKHYDSKSQTSEAEAYDRGFEDAMNGFSCRPSSLSYVDGYEHGRRVSLIGSARDEHRNPRSSSDD